MNRRRFIVAIGLLPAAGCTSGETGDDSTRTPNRKFEAFVNDLDGLDVVDYYLDGNVPVIEYRTTASSQSELKLELLGIGSLFQRHIADGWKPKEIQLILHENGEPALQFHIERDWAEWNAQGRLSNSEFVSFIYTNGKSI